MKRILIVVDYQNDFVSGSLGFPEAIKLEQPICEKIQAYRDSGDQVAFTLDTHQEDYLKTQEGQKLPVIHCVEKSEGWMLFGKVASAAGKEDQCFYKNTFGSSSMAEYLRDGEFESVEFAGVVSNICVLSNAVLAKTVLPEALIVVDARCTAGNDPDLHQKALDVMEGLHVAVLNRPSRKELKEAKL